MLHINDLYLELLFQPKVCDVLDCVFSKESSRVFSQFYESVYVIRRIDLKSSKDFKCISVVISWDPFMIPRDKVLR